jgi:hypothetical protein
MRQRHLGLNQVSGTWTVARRGGAFMQTHPPRTHISPLFVRPADTSCRIALRDSGGKPAGQVGCRDGRSAGSRHDLQPAGRTSSVRCAAPGVPTPRSILAHSARVMYEPRLSRLRPGRSGRRRAIRPAFLPRRRCCSAARRAVSGCGIARLLATALLTIAAAIAVVAACIQWPRHCAQSRWALSPCSVC